MNQSTSDYIEYILLVEVFNRFHIDERMIGSFNLSDILELYVWSRSKVVFWKALIF
jgi:hypothetical protein